MDKLLGAKFLKKGLRVETYVDDSNQIITKTFSVTAEITFIEKFDKIYI